MTALCPRWEFGSEFHLATPEAQPASPWLPEGRSLFATGRDALRALIQLGREARGWRRWFVPSYFCQEVVATIAGAGVAIVTYRDSPLWEMPAPLDERPGRGDAFLLVNYFGLRDGRAAESLDIGPADLIEDHTHDPWSDWANASRASYCIASLRKSLPVPDGAVLWSPRGLGLPPELPPAPHRETFSWMKLAAMTLKRDYLAGHDVPKEIFRQLQIRAEASLGDDETSGMTTHSRESLATLPWARWRRQRRANHAVLRKTLADVDATLVLSPSAAGDACPFAVVLTCDTPASREEIRTHLLANHVYPSVLWPIANNGAPRMAEAEELSRRVLCLACDFRYEASDLLRVAHLVRAVRTDRKRKTA